LREKLDPWLGKPTRKLNEGRATLLYRYESTGYEKIRMKLKVEINTREHFTVLGLNTIPFEMVNPWYTGKAKITTYHLEELLGTKLIALYQRRKGRDLFDLAIALQKLAVDDKIIVACFSHYMKEMGLKISRAEFEENLEIKKLDLGFRDDIIPLLSETRELKNKFEEDFKIISERLIFYYRAKLGKANLIKVNKIVNRIANGNFH